MAEQKQPAELLETSMLGKQCCIKIASYIYYNTMWVLTEFMYELVEAQHIRTVPGEKRNRMPGSGRMYKCERHCNRGAATDDNASGSTRLAAALWRISAHLLLALKQAVTAILVTLKKKILTLKKKILNTKGDLLRGS